MIDHELLEIKTKTKLKYSTDELNLYTLCLEFVHAKLNSQHFITTHKTNKGYFLFYIVKGQGVVYTQGELRGLKQNNLCLIDSSESFYISSNDWEFIYAYLEGDQISTIIKSHFKEIIFHIKDYHYLEKQFYYLNDYLLKKDYLMISSTVQKLLSVVLKSKDQIQNNHTPIELAKKYIEDHFNKEVRIDFLSSYVGFSKFHFIRLFKEVTNLTPHQYLIQIRLDHAQFLLRSTKKRISEIASLSGFKNEMNFYQNFHKYIAISPSRYRQL